MKTLDERVDERKDRHPFGFVSSGAYPLHRQKIKGRILDEAVAETEAKIAEYDKLIEAEAQAATSSR